MRVFIGTHEIANILTGLKIGFEELNIPVTTLIKDKNPLYKQSYTFEILRKKKITYQNSYLKKTGLIKLYEYFEFKKQNQEILKLLPQLIKDHDIFIFVWQSLLSDLSDYEILKKNGKKIVTIFVGSDVRSIEAFKQEFPDEIPYIEADLLNENINNPLYYLRTAELYSDLILSVPDQAGLALRGYNHLYLPFRKETCKFKYPKNTPLKVLHAPTRKGIKGTNVIINTLEKLKEEGINIEVTLLENMPNNIVLEKLTESDVLVDELHLHGPGMLSLEAMASGCAVATHTLSSYKDIFNPPVCNISINNIYHQLKFLLTNENYREELVLKGLSFIEKFNNPKNVASSILQGLHDPSKTEYTPSFYLRKFQTPKDIKISKKNEVLTYKVMTNYNIPI